MAAGAARRRPDRRTVRPTVPIAGDGPAMAKILLVEDNEMNRDMLSGASSRTRLRGASMADDGEAAPGAAARERPDLILMDMSLPVLDGWEATRRLKADARDRGHPGDRADRPRHGRRPRAEPRGRLRRLRHQADRARRACSARSRRLLRRPAPDDDRARERRGLPGGGRGAQPAGPSRPHPPGAAGARQGHHRLPGDPGRGGAAARPRRP